MKKESDPYTLEMLRVDVCWIKKILGNHLKHHEAYEIALIIGVLLLVAERILF